MTKTIYKKEGEKYFRITKTGITLIPNNKIPKSIKEKFLIQKQKQDKKRAKNKKKAKQKRKQKAIKKIRKVTFKRQFRKRKAKQIGRSLKSTEVIHHIDCNVANNNPKNLLITNASEHRKMHWQLTKLLKNDLKGKEIIFDLNERVYKLIPSLKRKLKK